MFGMGFTEILIIAVIAILFLGPDKLPGAMVDIAKFFRSAKNTIGSVKDTLEEELHVSDIKKEALAYKDELNKAKSALDIKSQVNSQLISIEDAILSDDDEEETKAAVVNEAPKEAQKVTFKKKKKEPKEEIADV